MKFKKLLSLSASFIVPIVLVGGLVTTGIDKDTGSKAQKASVPTNVMPKQNLRLKTDTIVLTDENFKKVFEHAAAAYFVPNSNTIYVNIFVADTDNDHIRKTVEMNNQGRLLVVRHEMEHAKKAHITNDNKNRLGWHRARVAVVDELMARGGEFIEALEYHIENGVRYPINRGGFVYRVDSLIMARHNEMTGGLGAFLPVDFQDRQIADIIINNATDRYLQVQKNHFYTKRIKNELNCIKRKKYVPNESCEIVPCLFNYLPEIDQWGAMWTYDVKAQWTVTGKKKVDLWNAASQSTRERTIAKIDSVVRQCFTPGQMLIKSTFSKTH